MPQAEDVTLRVETGESHLVIDVTKPVITLVVPPAQHVSINGVELHALVYSKAT